MIGNAGKLLRLLLRQRLNPYNFIADLADTAANFLQNGLNLSCRPSTIHSQLTHFFRYYAKEKTPVGSGWQLVTDDPNATNTAPIPANSENRVFQITNTPITYTLPETGGIGTLPYTAGGLLLMAAAALLLGQEIKRRREGC